MPVPQMHETTWRDNYVDLFKEYWGASGCSFWSFEDFATAKLRPWLLVTW